MGLDIGFNLYEKKPFDEKGEFVLPDLTTPWVCGRTNSTNSWGELFKFGRDDSEVPVFQKELDGKSRTFDSFTEKYVFTDFENFKSTVMSSVDDDLAECHATKQAMHRRINELREKISELRELQKTCTEENGYAFDRWEEHIRGYTENIHNLQEDLTDFEDNDYEYCHAIAVRELLADMERYIKENKYYVIPIFSF